MPSLRPAEWAVLIFTLLYVAVFSAVFLAAGNHEFLWYVFTMLVLIGIVGVAHTKTRLPVSIMAALSIWGLAHMAGGGLQVGDGVLYGLMLVPLAPPGELTILKYDQVVHFYGFGVTAWLLWHILRHHFPMLEGSATLYVFPALASMGLGATNEIIEFIAVVVFPNTNVGGYYNTALDLVFNALGAVTAMVLARLLGERSSP